MTGNPGHRPALVDFANLITKKTSLLICGHVMTGDQVSVRYLNTLKDNVQNWMKDHGIQGSVVIILKFNIVLHEIQEIDNSILYFLKFKT